MVEPHSKPNIFTVVQVLRSFSNEVTVNALASQLNVSYSTLNRCRTGICPPSITFNSLKGAFDAYKDRFFDGDERLLVDAALNQLRLLGIAAQPYESEFENAGYDAFVNMLLGAALNRPKTGRFVPTTRVTASQQSASPVEALLPIQEHFTNNESIDAQETPATIPPNDPKPNPQVARISKPPVDLQEHTAQKTPEGFSGERGIVGYLALAVVVGIGLLQLPLNKIVAWTLDHTLLFFGISFALAILPTVLGLSIDSPIAWARCKQREPDVRFSWGAWQRAAKYGSPNRIVVGEGRYNPTRAHCTFALLSNISGMLCPVAIVGFLQVLPGFASYIDTHNWTEFFKAGVALGFYIGYQHTREQQNLPRPEHMDNRYNPDNYLYTRIHVWANIVHLVWVISISSMLALCMLGYGFAHFQQVEMPLLVLWPVAQTALFLIYANVSPYPIRVRTTSIGSFVSGLVIMAGCMLLATTSFRFSWTSVVVCLVYAALACLALVWRRHLQRDPDMNDWMKQGSGARIYSVIVAVSILAMAVIGLATSAFV